MIVVAGRPLVERFLIHSSVCKTAQSTSYLEVRYGTIKVMRSFRTVVSTKGQVVIPAELRQEYGLGQGTPATWTEEAGRLVLTPMTERRIKEIRGFLKPKAGEATMFDELFAERERERRREDQ
jgi:AbrB family looped-hinge helix DNA binding protein